MIELNREVTDPQHVAFYTELVKFQANNSLRETQFKSPNKAHRRVLHYLADEMDLEYEYTLATQTVTITKQYLSASVPISQHESFGLFNFSDLGVPGQLHGDVSGISDEVLHSTTLTGHVVPMQCHAEGSNSSYAFQDLGFDSNSQLYSLQNHPFEQYVVSGSIKCLPLTEEGPKVGGLKEPLAFRLPRPNAI